MKHNDLMDEEAWNRHVDKLSRSFFLGFGIFVAILSIVGTILHFTLKH